MIILLLSITASAYSESLTYLLLGVSHNELRFTLFSLEDVLTLIHQMIILFFLAFFLSPLLLLRFLLLWTDRQSYQHRFCLQQKLF